eukprot:CAMPEP_0171295760 /NCGR_PEP_ID=MMETSP0816-20121228/4387_1 /TAXON_ID=420281 /ORGANISM="Proboscia inermis, Strain CCAP1064/1" /LENGTH=113 /DNA_ID=CAMNT_0011768683 /DNA_START=151 /DNA_END=492 /DNA_ORIENTATION=-
MVDLKRSTTTVDVRVDDISTAIPVLFSHDVNVSSGALEYDGRVNNQQSRPEEISYYSVISTTIKNGDTIYFQFEEVNFNTPVPTASPVKIESSPTQPHIDDDIPMFYAMSVEP